MVYCSNRQLKISTIQIILERDGKYECNEISFLHDLLLLKIKKKVSKLPKVYACFFWIAAL